jgi:cold shock CspA family protein
VPIERMRVLKYLPDRLYGFVEGASGPQVFFHLGSFCPGSVEEGLESPPPPVLGEEVLVTYPELTSENLTTAPRATRVERVTPQVPLEGTVRTMDATRGFGFLEGSDGQTYHLHRSEVVDGLLPLFNQTLVFYPGTRHGKPRACHVRAIR